MKRNIALIAALLLLVLGGVLLASCDSEEARGVPVYKGSFLAGGDDYVRLDDGADLNVYSDEGSTSVFSVDGATGDVASAGDLSLSGALDSALNLENMVLPSVVKVTASSTITTGVALTSAAGEIYEIVDVFYFVETSFDCTGDDCTLDVGTGDDVDGFLDCADATLQDAYTDYTGADAGWGGLDGSAPTGAFLVGGPHIMSGDETIDFAVGGTDPAAGSVDIYIVYRKLQ